MVISVYRKIEYRLERLALTGEWLAVGAYLKAQTALTCKRLYARKPNSDALYRVLKVTIEEIEDLLAMDEPEG